MHRNWQICVCDVNEMDIENMSTLKAKNTFTYMAHGLYSNLLDQTKSLRIIVCWNSARNKAQCVNQFKFVNKEATYDPCERGLNVISYLSVLERVWESSIQTRPRIRLNYSRPTMFPINAKKNISIASSDINSAPLSTLVFSQQSKKTDSICI